MDERRTSDAHLAAIEAQLQALQSAVTKEIQFEARQTQAAIQLMDERMKVVREDVSSLKEAMNDHAKRLSDIELWRATFLAEWKGVFKGARIGYILGGAGIVGVFGGVAKALGWL